MLPHHTDRGTVLLTRQFRWPVFVNGHPDGLLVKAAAGLLDDDDPMAAAKREAAEEPGAQLRDGRVDDAKAILLLQWAVL